MFFLLRSWLRLCDCRCFAGSGHPDSEGGAAGEHGSDVGDRGGEGGFDSSTDFDGGDGDDYNPYDDPNSLEGQALDEAIREIESEFSRVEQAEMEGFYWNKKGELVAEYNLGGKTVGLTDIEPGTTFERIDGGWKLSESGFFGNTSYLDENYNRFEPGMVTSVLNSANTLLGNIFGYNGQLSVATIKNLSTIEAIVNIGIGMVNAVGAITMIQTYSKFGYRLESAMSLGIALKNIKNIYDSIASLQQMHPGSFATGSAYVDLGVFESDYNDNAKVRSELQNLKTQVEQANVRSVNLSQSMISDRKSVV